MSTTSKKIPRQTVRTAARMMALLLAAHFILTQPCAAAPKNLAWRGTVNTNWDTTGNTNWFDTVGHTNAPFSTGDKVTFDDTGTGNPVNITNAVQPGSVTVSANVTNYIFSGPGGITNLNSVIAGTNLVGLTKNNNGTLTIQTTNTYTGVTTLNGGIVSVGSLTNGGIASPLGAAASASSNLVFNGGQLQYTGPNDTFNRGATLSTNGGTLAVTIGGVILTNSGVIAGIGGLTVSSNGTLALSGANTYGGGTLVNAGTTLKLISTTATSFGAGSGNITNNGTLLFAGTNVVGNNISGAGILTNAAGSVLLLSGSNTFSANIYNGTTNLAPSTLILSNSTPLNGTFQVILAGGNSSTLNLAGNSLSLGGSVTIPSSVTLVMETGSAFANRATLANAGVAGIWNGPIQLVDTTHSSGGDFCNFSSASASAPLIINGNVTINGGNIFNGNVTLVGVGGVMNGTFSVGPASLLNIATTSGSWTINSTGNSWGISDIANGKIVLGANNALPVTVPVEFGGAGTTNILDLNGYNQQVAGLVNNASGKSITLITNSTPVSATLTYSNSANFFQSVFVTNGVSGTNYAGAYTNYSAVIGGKVALNVAGGVLNLSGTNTYSAPTTIGNGALLLSGSASIARTPNIIIGTNATFDVSALSSTFTLGSGQTLTGLGGTGTLAGNINMASASSLVLNYVNGTPTLTVANGTLTCINSGVLTINVSGSLPIGPSFSYLLISAGAGGQVAGTPPSAVAVNGVGNVAGSLSISNGGLYLTVTNYTPKNLVWNGAVNGNWDNTANTNWFDTDTGGLTNFYTLDNVTFDDTGVSNLVNLSGPVQPSTIMVSANTINYTLSGAGSIVGTAGLTKNNNGTLTIQTTNSYSGVTTLNGGIVSVGQLDVGGSPTAIGAAGSDPANLVFNGGQLQYTGPSMSIDRGATLNASGGALAVTTPGNTLTTSGTIAGSGGLTVLSNGMVALSGANTYSGGTTVSAGTTLGLVDGGTFGTGSVTNNGALLFSGANAVGNKISGPGILTNAPGGILTLGGTNTFTGNVFEGVTNQTASTLTIGSSSALPNNVTVTISGLNGTTIYLSPGVSTPTNTTLVMVSGNANANRGTLNSLGAGTVWNGPIQLVGDGLSTGDFVQFGASSAPATINGNVTAATNGPTAFNGQFDVRSANGVGVLNGSFLLGAGCLWAVNDGASWTLNSTNNTWAISDIANGKITLGARNALPVNVPLEGSGANSPGILDLNGNNQQIAGLTNLASGTGNFIITNSSVVPATLIYSNPADFYQAVFSVITGSGLATNLIGNYTNFSGIIGGNMSLSVVGGVLTLTSANTYTGVTSISNAVLALTASGSIANTTNIIIGTNAVFSPSSQNLNSGQTLTGVGGTGTIAGNLNLGSGSSLVLNYTTNTPTLTVSNATLNFSSGNALAVTVNMSGSLIAQQSYLLISTTNGGVVSGTPPSSVTVNGLTNAPGTYGVFLTISGGQLYLTLSKSPVILGQFPVPYTNLFTLYKGASPAFLISGVGGAPPFAYRWFTNGVLDGAASTNSLQLSNLQASFANDYCIVTNIYGAITSFVWSASVIADPTNSAGGLATYPTNVLSLNPIGYWRLNEPDDGNADGNPGVIAHDYAGGNDALYTNVNLSQPGYNPLADPSDTSASFGFYPSYPSSADCYAGSILGIDVSATNGVNGEFTVQAWVNATNQQSANNGIAAKGYFGQEEFSLDTGAPGNAFRFEVRNDAGTAYNANSTVINYDNNGLWHHLVGVCDEAAGSVLLYIDGQLAASASIPAGSGIYNSFATPMTIGARATSATSGVTNQFYGNINDVAVFNYALSSSQVAAEYQAAGPFPPVIISQFPLTYTNLFTLFAGASPTFSVTAIGTAPLVYQWFTNGVLDGAATTNSLALTNVQSGFTNYCIVTNSAGSATSMVWSAAVIADPTAPYPAAVLAAHPIGYWRLNEGPDDGNGDQGVIANDYLGGNNGLYTNVNLAQNGYNPTTDPGETSTLFGETGISFYDSDAGQIGGIDFSAPSNTSPALTVEAWVNGFNGGQIGGGIVSKGYGGGGEQFDLDLSGSAFRFIVRDAHGGTHGPTSTFHTDSNWHHVVGVCDEPNGLVSLYIDGQLRGSSSIPTNAGLLSATNLMIIGSRTSTANTNNNLQFYGYLNDVAVYNYALSSNQIVGQYVSAGVSPYFIQPPPTNVTVNEGGTLVLPAIALGTAPLTNTWYDINGGTNVSIGKTNGYPDNATLNYTNVPAAWNGDTLQLTVANAYGSTNFPVTLTVFSGLNVTLGPPSLALYAGTPETYSAVASGTQPFHYQWYTNGVGVGNATNATYSVVTPAGSETISCTVSNAYNGYSVTNVGPVSLSGIAAPTNLYPLTVLSNHPVAYWRLGEADDGLNDGNPGVIAHDYVGGHNAIYTNVDLGVPGYNPAKDPDTAALFGVFAAANSYAGEVDQSGNGLANINFATPVGGNAEFSIEAWVNSTNATQGGGIVTKGYGNGGEQFNLDMTANNFRFFVRDASGAVHGPTSTVDPVVGQWYHVVGVWDGANGAAHLYINGVDNIDATGVAPGVGLLTATTTNTALPGAALVSIGARTASQAATSYGLQWQGVIDDVAIYNYALSSNQVAADYLAGANIPATPTISLTNLVIHYTGTLRSATNVTGPYAPVAGASSPYTIPATNSQQFYRTSVP